MSYKIVWPDTCITYDSLIRIPKAINESFKKIGPSAAVDIVCTDDDLCIGEFESQMQLLRCKYFEMAGYEPLETHKDGKLTNPCYFYIKGDPDSTLAFFETPELVRVSKTTLEDAINHMNDQDILLNEMLNDSPGLRGKK